MSSNKFLRAIEAMLGGAVGGVWRAGRCWDWRRRATGPLDSRFASTVYSTLGDLARFKSCGISELGNAGALAAGAGAGAGVSCLRILTGISAS
jgi:hypothetical protein